MKETYFWNSGTTPPTNNCPKVITGVASRDTGLSPVEIPTLDGATHKLELPIGAYNYHIYSEDKNCSLQVQIKGKYNYSESSI